MEYSYENECKKYLLEAQTFLELRRYEQANNSINKALSVEPNNSFAWYLKSHYFFVKKEYEEAIESCIKSMESGAFVGKCKYLLGNIYKEQKKYAKAETCYLESLEVSRNQADVISEYAMLMLITGNNEKAKKLLNEALRMEPENAVVLRCKFIFSVAKSKGNDQVQTLERYMRVCNSEVEKLVMIGTMEFNRGNYKKAKDAFKEAYLMQPMDAELLSLLKYTEEMAHILFFPQRLVNKMGGQAVVWIVVMVLILVFSKVYPVIAVILAVSYLLLAILSWLLPGLYKIMKKFNRNI